MNSRFNKAISCLLVTTALSTPALAADSIPTPDANVQSLYDVPIEKLVGLDYIVTSPDKREEKLLDATSAVYVVSQEDIRRSGATNIPDVLREVPGLDVARVNAHAWAISARGFNALYSNKLLVMVDGRSLYTPEFSGVLWEDQNIPLENIERIEVIRGPGATMWGANAVNGVINIITKTAKDMQGNLMSGGTGTIDTGFGTVRHGGKISDDAYYSVYATTTDDVSKEPYEGVSRNLSYHMTHEGFRSDWDPDTRDQLTFSGDAYSGDEHDLNINVPFDPSDYAKGGDVSGQWTHNFSSVSKLQVNSYVDTLQGNYNPAEIRNTTYDLDAQHTYDGFDRHEIVWGAGMRFIDVDQSSNPGYIVPVTFDSDYKLLHVLNGFVQDQYALIPDKWFLTLGSKIEDNSFTGVEIEPSARMLWKITDAQSVWTAVTRSVRTPNVSEEDLINSNGPFAPHTLSALPFPAVISVLPNSNMESEQEFSYEIGYRNEVSKKANLDTTAFYNEYGNLASVLPGAPYLQNGTLIVPYSYVNEMHAKTYGFEVAPSWQVTKDWSLKGSYSLLMVTSEGNESDVLPEIIPRTVPNNQFDVISYLNLPHFVEFDTSLKYQDGIKAYMVPAYFSLNARLGWKPLENDGLELSLTGENLFDRQHYEFNQVLTPTTATAIPIPQDIIAKVTLKF